MTHSSRLEKVRNGSEHRPVQLVVLLCWHFIYKWQSDGSIYEQRLPHSLLGYVGSFM